MVGWEYSQAGAWQCSYFSFWYGMYVQLADMCFLPASITQLHKLLVKCLVSGCFARLVCGTIVDARLPGVLKGAC